MDEPWSRPGDYVLLRAMNDLVCASSACPDDIDPANGWQITPVHVRVYAPDNTFSVAIAHRVTADADPVFTRETTFHPRTSALTKSFVEYRGYWLPHCFDNEGAIAEYWACREQRRDHGPLAAPEVGGARPRRGERSIQRAITRDARRLSVGQVTYTALCNETGGMIDDATVYRLGQDNFRFVGGDEYDGVWLKELADRDGLRVLREALDGRAPQRRRPGPGEPRSPAARSSGRRRRRPSLDDLRWFRFTIGRIGGYDGIPIVVSRTGYTGELGYEVWCHPSDGPAVWDAICRGGRGSRADPARSRGPRHAPDRVRPHLRRLRVRRPGRPVRGRHRLRGRPRHGGRLRRARSARGAAGASAARARRARARGERDRRARRRRLRRPAARRCRHERHAKPDPPEERSRSRASPCSTPRPGRRSRWASSTASRSASRRPSSASRSTTPRRRGPARDRVARARAARGVPPRRLPHRRGGPRLGKRARASP